MFNTHYFNTATFNEIRSGGKISVSIVASEADWHKFTPNYGKAALVASGEGIPQKITLGDNGDNETLISTIVEEFGIKVACGMNNAKAKTKVMWQNPFYVPSGFSNMFNSVVFDHDEEKLDGSRKIINLLSNVYVLADGEQDGAKLTTGDALSKILATVTTDWSKLTTGYRDLIVFFIPEARGFNYRCLYVTLTVGGATIIGNTITLKAEFKDKDIDGEFVDIMNPKVVIYDKSRTIVEEGIPNRTTKGTYVYDLVVPGYSVAGKRNEPLVFEFSGIIGDQTVVGRQYLDREWCYD